MRALWIAARYVEALSLILIYVALVRGSLKTPYDVLFRDIARSGAALRESEERFRRLSDASLEGIAIVEGGVITAANRAVVEMFGYEREEVVGMSPIDFAASESRDLIARNMAGGCEDPYEVTQLRRGASRCLADPGEEGVRGHDRFGRT